MCPTTQPGFKDNAVETALKTEESEPGPSPALGDRECWDLPEQSKS